MNIGKPIEARIGSREAAVLRRQSGGRIRRVETSAIKLLQPLPYWAWLIAAVVAVWGLSSQYAMLTVASVMTLPILATLLLIKGESPILFCCAAMQWLQIVAAVFYCDIWGGTLEWNFFYPEMENATWLSLRAIIALALGMRLALGGWHTATTLVTNQAQKLSVPRLVRLWWGCFFIASIAGRLAWFLGGLSQLAYAVVGIKWVVFYMLVCRVLAKNDSYHRLVKVMLVEFATGLIGFFSGFKEVLLMFLVATMTTHRKFSSKVKLIVTIVVIVGVGTGILWQAVKGEYRAIISRGTTVQGALVPIEVRISAMGELITTMNAQKWDAGFNSLAQRISYTQLFGATLANVPSFVPYEHGELWKSAILHVMAPRLIFPNKAVIDDSERARKYTGIDFAGSEAGTSIGIGYVAESYVDFGPYGMMVPIFLLGLLMGRIYRFFIQHSISRLLGTAIGTTVLFSMLAAYATCNSKILGALLVQCLVMGILNIAYGKRILIWLTTDPDQPRR